MKAILEFDLTEERAEFDYALAGLDALLVIDDLLNEIRNKLKYDSGSFKEWNYEDYDDSGKLFDKKLTACDYTLERVREVLINLKEERRLPELV